MFNLLGKIFGGGTVKAIETVATEWIETDMEKAEAKALFVKTLDPNGAMRREISQTVSGMYVIYILIMMILVLLQSFGIGDQDGVKIAIENLVSLFEPITWSFISIVGASFGVNGMNVHKETKENEKSS